MPYRYVFNLFSTRWITAALVETVGVPSATLLLSSSLLLLTMLRRWFLYGACRLRQIWVEPIVLKGLSMVFPTIRIWPDSTSSVVIEWLHETLQLFGLQQQVGGVRGEQWLIFAWTSGVSGGGSGCCCY